MHYYQVMLNYVEVDFSKNDLDQYFMQFIKESESIVIDTTDYLEHFKPLSEEDTCKKRLLVSRLRRNLQIMSLKCTQCRLKEAGMTLAC